MRVAAIYDIHGNLPALEAVLKEIEDASVEAEEFSEGLLQPRSEDEMLALFSRAELKYSGVQ